jgi:sugar phosphate isomerase/epimerase
MDFLFSSNILADYPLKTALITLAENDISGVEIWVEHLWRLESPLNEVRKLMDSLGLKRTLHAPTRDVNITSSNPGIRKESLNQVLDALDIAYKLGIEVVTVHPGRMSSSKDTPEEFFDEQLNSLFAIARKAMQLGLRVAVEVMESKKGELVVLPQDLNTLLDAIGIDSLGATFDIAHAASFYKGLATIETINDYIVDYMYQLKRIYNVHVSNSSSRKVHLPLSRGEYDFLPVLSELSSIYSGTVSIEGFVPGEGMEVLFENKGVIDRWKRALLPKGERK